MLPVTRNQTLSHDGQKNFFAKHLCKIDKHHIENFDLLKLESGLKSTEFNEDLINKKLFSIPKNRLIQFHQHNTGFKDMIAALEKLGDDGQALFIPINDSVKIRILS